MSPLDWLFASLLVAAGASIQGSLGFGLGLVSAPILALIEHDFVPGPVIAASLPLSLMVAWRERAELNLREVGWAVTGRVPGTIAGALAVSVLPEKETAVLLAGSVILAVVLAARGWTVPITTPTLITAGVASGFMGTTTSIGGPPIALVYASATGPRMRSALATYFAVGATFSLVTLAAFGEFGGREILLALGLWPGMLAGFGLSRLVSRHLDRGRTRAAVLITSAISAVALVVTNLL